MSLVKCKDIPVDYMFEGRHAVSAILAIRIIVDDTSRVGSSAYLLTDLVCDEFCSHGLAKPSFVFGPVHPLGPGYYYLLLVPTRVVMWEYYYA